MSDRMTRLVELKAMLDQGFITRAEYDALKAELFSAVSSSAPQAADPLLGATRAGPLPTQPPSHPRLPERIGSYRILSELGRGGMGTVVRARHIEEGWAQRQGGDVAIKLIHPQLAADPAYRARFLDEARLGRRLSHPSLAAVHDVVAEGSWLGAVMAFVDGTSLSERIRSGGLPLEQVVTLLRPLAEALDHLHAQGIIHRDLKPANIKIRRDGRPVILDLGIAKDQATAGDGHTQTGTVLGTTAWMAPEQVDAKATGPAADRYALGLMAYGLLAGRLP